MACDWHGREPGRSPERDEIEASPKLSFALSEVEKRIERPYVQSVCYRDDPGRALSIRAEQGEGVADYAAGCFGISVPARCGAGGGATHPDHGRQWQRQVEPLSCFAVLLAETAQGRLVASLAAEGGLSSTLWAGPERFSREMLSGRQAVQGTVRTGPVSLRLGFAGADFGYAVDLGLPDPTHPFQRDPEIKVEAMWTGEMLGRANLFAERRAPMVSLRRADSGQWRHASGELSAFDSMVTHCADPVDGLELLLMRERMRNWRFYDNLRTDADAPARRPQVMTYTPVLASDGGDLAAAIATILAIGEREELEETIEDAFPGSQVQVQGGDENAPARPVAAAACAGIVGRDAALSVAVGGAAVAATARHHGAERTGSEPASRAAGAAGAIAGARVGTDADHIGVA